MKKLLLMICLVVVSVPLLRSQDEAMIQKLFQDAIQAMGGDAYLNVTDIVTEGQIFYFNAEGNSTIPIKYSDYTKFPDKSRFEIGNKKKERDITVFNLGKNEGWILEGQKETRSAKADEMDDFRNTVKHSIDMILRFRFKDPENKLFYLGPGEDKDAMLEIVKLVDPANDEVLVYFDRISKLPAKIEYRDINDKGVRQRHVEEYAQWHIIQGVKTPMRVSGYTNGRRSSQQFPLKIMYNNNLPDTLFAKPVRPK